MNSDCQIFILMNMIKTPANHFAPFRLLLLNFSITFMHPSLTDQKFVFESDIFVLTISLPMNG